MKEKEKKYIKVTKYNEHYNGIEEERLYLIEGKVFKEYIEGNFVKSNNTKKALELFASEAHIASVVSSKKVLTIKVKKGCYIFKEDVRGKVYNLRISESRKEFLNIF